MDGGKVNSECELHVATGVSDSRSTDAGATARPTRSCVLTHLTRLCVRDCGKRRGDGRQRDGSFSRYTTAAGIKIVFMHDNVLTR